MSNTAATTLVRLTAVSSNRKVGPIPVTTTERKSCPSTCPLLGNGCYAGGGPLKRIWDETDNGSRSMAWDDFTKAIKRLPKGQMWRHNQAGDLPQTDGLIAAREVNALVKANKGRKGFTYTHHDVLGLTPYAESNRLTIAKANAEGFTVNLSANGMPEADALAALGIAPVVTVLPVKYERTSAKGEWTETEAEYKARISGLDPLTTPEGRKVVVCPAARANISCAACGICATQRKAIVGFPAHGYAKRKAAKTITN